MKRTWRRYWPVVALTVLERLAGDRLTHPIRHRARVPLPEQEEDRTLFDWPTECANLSLRSRLTANGLLHSRHQIVEFLDPQHPDVSHGHCKPRQVLRKGDGRQDTGHSRYGFSAKVDAPLLPGESVLLKNEADFLVGVVVGVAIVARNCSMSMSKAIAYTHPTLLKSGGRPCLTCGWAAGMTATLMTIPSNSSHFLNHHSSSAAPNSRMRRCPRRMRRDGRAGGRRRTIVFSSAGGVTAPRGSYAAPGRTSINRGGVNHDGIRVLNVLHKHLVRFVAPDATRAGAA